MCSANTVLIIEDYKPASDLFQRLLDKKGYKSIATDDPYKIINLLKSGTVGLVLLDIVLNSSIYEGRHISGLDVAVFIHKFAPNVPILLLTAYAMAGDQEELMKQTGAKGYISKPVTDLNGFVALVGNYVSVSGAKK